MSSSSVLVLIAALGAFRGSGDRCTEVGNALQEAASNYSWTQDTEAIKEWVSECKARGNPACLPAFRECMDKARVLKLPSTSREVRACERDYLDCRKGNVNE